MTQTTTTKKPKTQRTSTKSIISSPPENAFQFEILDYVCAQRTKAKKIEMLQKYQNDALVSLFIWNYDTSVISLIPEGDVPYSRAEDLVSSSDTLSGAIEKQIDDKMVDMVGGNSKTSLRTEVEKFHMFIQGGNNTLSGIRRETIFIQMLEGLHPREAEIVCLVKDKKLTDRYNLPFELIKEAYPFIRWGRS